MVLFRGCGPSGELSWWGIVLGIVVLVGNGWAFFLSGGELSSWGVVQRMQMHGDASVINETSLDRVCSVCDGLTFQSLKACEKLVMKCN